MVKHTFHARLTFLDELDVGLSPPVAVLHVAGVVAKVALLQRVDGQRDRNLLLSQVLPDCPIGRGERGGGESNKYTQVSANETRRPAAKLCSE